MKKNFFVYQSILYCIYIVYSILIRILGLELTEVT